MSEAIKGYEIFKLIANNEVKDGTQFRMLKDENVYTYRNNNFVCKYGGMNVIAILNNEFEIIEEQQDIDIQEIEELENWFVDEREEYREFDIQALNLCFRKHKEKINELVQAVKQLDLKVKEK